MLSRLFTKTNPHDARIEQFHILRAEHTLIHPLTEREYKIIVLDAEDSLDVIIQYPDDAREAVWSLTKDNDPFDADNTEEPS